MNLILCRGIPVLIPYAVSCWLLQVYLVHAHLDHIPSKMIMPSVKACALTRVLTRVSSIHELRSTHASISSGDKYSDKSLPDTDTRYVQYMLLRNYHDIFPSKFVVTT